MTANRDREYRAQGVAASSVPSVRIPLNSQSNALAAERSRQPYSALVFTGLVQGVGRVSALERRGDVLRIRVNLGAWAHRPEAGSSIAVNGCCLTVVDERGDGDEISFDAIAQTLAVTTLGSWRVGDAVNLEHAVTPTTLLGGHLVQGHVDARATVTRVQTEGEWRLQVRVPAEYANCVVERGSIAIDGVSLTIARVQDATDGSRAVLLEVCLIPETLARTNLQSRIVGDEVNVEVDAMAKLVAKLVASLIARQLKA